MGVKSDKDQDVDRNVDSEAGLLRFRGGIGTLLGTGLGAIRVTSGEESGCILPAS